ESMALTEQGTGISARVTATLQEIVTAVSQVTEVVSQIARASNEQAEGIEQSNKAMGQMDQVTQQAAANSEESSSAAEELASQAQELAGLVGQFQLGGRGPVMPKAAAPQKSIQRAVRPVFQAPKRPSMRSNGRNGRAHASALLPIENDPDFREF